MKVRLRVLHGKLLDQAGHGKGMEVKIHGPRFVIGSAADCSMCCKSTSVSPHHCEIFVGQRQVSVRPLCQEASTFVNDEQVSREKILRAGDRLRVGRLEFEVVIKSPAPTDHPSTLASDGTDQAEKELSDMLVEADAKERAFRLQHPELRELHLESAPPKEPAVQEPKEVEGKSKRGKKAKRLPGGLPVPPVKQTEDSTEAAQEALRRMFRP